MNMPDLFSFRSPLKIQAGKRALENIPMELAGRNARKPLILCSARGGGAAEKLATAFGDSGLSIVLWENVPAEPDLTMLRDLWRLHRDRGCDAIIALGGGPTADAAKVLNIAVSGRPEDMERVAGGAAPPGPLRPFLYCPTTPGNGRETSRFARLERLAFSSMALVPDLAVIDPRILREGPAGALTAAVVRALATAVEACLGPAHNPLTDVYASVAIRLLTENAAGKRKRSDLLPPVANALCLSGIVLSNVARGPATVLAEAMAKTAGIPEATALAILLPHTAALTAKENPPAAKMLLSYLAGAFPQTPPGERAAQIGPAIARLIREFAGKKHSPPDSFAAAGLRKEVLAEAAQYASCDGTGIGHAKGMEILSRAWAEVP